MKNALKFVGVVAAFIAFWYVTFGWRISSEPLSGGYVVKAMVDYHQR